MASREVDDTEPGRIDIGDRDRVSQASAKGRGLQMLTGSLVHVKPTEATLVQRHSAALGAGKNRRVAGLFHHIGEMRQLGQPQARAIGS
ncbi:hypothetical protein D9M70_619790 [compost metagenome]